MPHRQISRFLLLPELKLIQWTKVSLTTNYCEASKTSFVEVCPKCATPSRSVYDTRKVKLKDQPMRGKQVILLVAKRRFYCRPCKETFHRATARRKKGAPNHRALSQIHSLGLRKLLRFKARAKGIPLLYLVHLRGRERASANQPEKQTQLSLAKNDWHR